MNICIRNHFLRSNLLGSYCRFSATIAEIEQDDQVLINDTEDEQVKEVEIQKKRNKSRLTAAHFNLMNDKRPYDEPHCLAHLTVKYSRKMYGKYGITSGINPSLCWPTKQEIQEVLEYESIAYPYTIKEAMLSAAEKRKQENMRILQRDQEVAEKFAKLDMWKKELQNKIEKKAAEVKAAKQKKERLVEEVRRHFGFTLDPRDERFQEMLAKREKEQKKQERLAKREAKEKIMLAKLQQKSAEVNQ